MKHAFLWLLPAAIFLLSVASSAQEPPLPEGLGNGGGPSPAGSDEPSLPEGLQPSPSPEQPALPRGLGKDMKQEAERTAAAPVDTAPILSELSGFIDLRGGLRTGSDPHEPDTSLGELRLQVEGEKAWNRTVVHGRIDFVYDTVALDHDIHLNEGRGWLDLREASILLRPLSFMDLEAGRQILTWGEGDLVFINDMFPKDWNSFFLGRAVEYLKAPSDAVKASFYTGRLNINAVYTPQFDSDRYIDGRVVSYYNAGQQEIAGRNAIVRADEPDRIFEDDELAVRIYDRIRSFEVALYGYSGFWKSPAGSDPASGRAQFPGLYVYGASIRGPLFGGIGRSEFGWYDSYGDRDGDDPLVRNSELRLLFGFDHELAKNFNGSAQYYLEYMLAHDDYLRTLPPGMPARDKDRHVLTLRLTRLLMNQNLELSFFAFYSPSDEDAYLRPLVQYKIDNHWSVSCGGNFFPGRKEHTFFGQFENNSNVYGAVRYSY